MSTEHVVVVGAGMVGHRVVEEVVRRDADHRLEVHLVGDEHYAPYNRILLSDVLAGRCDLAALALPEPPADRVRLHRGVAAVGLDRQRRTVLLSDGGRLAYDHLVLATGARSFVPPVPGLRPEPPAHAHVLRTLDDCREISARALNARHAVVLGGGVLGLEAACGLAARGVGVTLVDLAATLAPTQLDPGAASVLAASLHDLGVEVRTGHGIEEVQATDGAVSAVRLTGGEVLDTDLLVVSCGIQPRTELARDAGLPVERGVVVDADQRSPADHAVRAVGDCAQGNPGLVAPGWEEAARVAASIVGQPAPPNGTADAPPVVRLKAAGVDMVTMGVRPSQADHRTDRVLTLSDPLARRHVELTLTGARLTGVTCVGAPDLAAALSVAFDRRTPVPTDPLALLLPEAAGEEGSPALMPSHTPVCRCNGVTKGDIVAAWDRGACSVAEVAGCTRATTGCGGCRPLVGSLVDWLRSSDPASEAAATSQDRRQRGERDVSAVQHEHEPHETSAP